MGINETTGGSVFTPALKARRVTCDYSTVGRL